MSEADREGGEHGSVWLCVHQQTGSGHTEARHPATPVAPESPNSSRYHYQPTIVHIVIDIIFIVRCNINLWDIEDSEVEDTTLRTGDIEDRRL